jgi:hypothetical protein
MKLRTRAPAQNSGLEDPDVGEGGNSLATWAAVSYPKRLSRLCSNTSTLFAE